MGERHLYKVGQGNETTVYGSVRNDRTSKLVLKLLEKPFGHGTSEGFDQATADELREQYQILQACYPKFIVWQKIMPRQDGENFFLAQERLNLCDPADVFAYLPEAFTDEIKEQLVRLTRLLKQNYTSYLTNPDAQVLPLDLVGKANLVITIEGGVQYVDTSHSIHPFSTMQLAELLTTFKARVAWLELLAGRRLEALIDDQFYADLLRDPAAKDLTSAATLQTFFEAVVHYCGAKMPEAIFLSTRTAADRPSYADAEDDFFAQMHARGDRE